MTTGGRKFVPWLMRRFGAYRIGRIKSGQVRLLRSLRPSIPRGERETIIDRIVEVTNQHWNDNVDYSLAVDDSKNPLYFLLEKSQPVFQASDYFFLWTKYKRWRGFSLHAKFQDGVERRMKSNGGEELSKTICEHIDGATDEVFGVSSPSDGRDVFDLVRLVGRMKAPSEVAATKAIDSVARAYRRAADTPGRGRNFRSECRYALANIYGAAPSTYDVHAGRQSDAAMKSLLSDCKQLWEYEMGPKHT